MPLGMQTGCWSSPSVTHITSLGRFAWAAPPPHGVSVRAAAALPLPRGQLSNHPSS
jgi:hypothetical protein